MDLKHEHWEHHADLSVQNEGLTPKLQKRGPDVQGIVFGETLPADSLLLLRFYRDEVPGPVETRQRSLKSLRGEIRGARAGVLAH